MTPAARISAAITILDRILNGEPAEAALIRWSRSSRFAGSGDRSAVRDLVFDSLRRRQSRAALGGGLSGRGLMLGMCRETGLDPETVFSGEGHAPARLSDDEKAGGDAPSAQDALDLPAWVLPEWQAALGDQADAVARAMRERAPVWLRVNGAKTTPQAVIERLAAEGISAAASPLLPSALEIGEGARKLTASQTYAEGWVELQDLSPQLACAALPAQGSVLDYCAGGGGKALALAARGAALVAAHDIDAARMADLPERARRAGTKIKVLAPKKVTGTFDLVMADVPCSGSGTWRRTPDAKWRLQQSELERLTALQAQILDEAANFTRPGGLLAYMTCSVLRRENHDQISAFLARDPRFTQQSMQDYSPLYGSDGFFLAVLRRD